MSKWKATPDGVMCAMQRGEVVHCLRWFEKAGPTISLGEDEDLLAVSPDGTALATSNWRSRAIHVHDAVSARKRVSFLGHKSLPIQAVFSSDGNTLATGSTIGELKVWDVVTGQELLALDLVPGEVWGLAFSHDGTMLAASGAVSGGGYTTVYLAPPASDLEE